MMHHSMRHMLWRLKRRRWARFLALWKSMVPLTHP